MGLEREHPASLCADTRELKSGARFFVLGSFDFDRFGPQLRAANLHSLVCDQEIPLQLEVPMEIVGDARCQFLKECTDFYRKDFEAFEWTAVTGTKGKTSIAWTLYNTWQELGVKAAYIGTLGIEFPGFREKGLNTTPGLQQMLKLLPKMRAAGVKKVALEASSQGMMQHRFPVDLIKHRIFTDLSEEHLDAHGTMEAYLKEKNRLFKGYGFQSSEDATAHVLARSQYKEGVLKGFEGKVLEYGLEENRPDYNISHFETGLFQMKVRLKGQAEELALTVPGFGAFQLENLLAVVSVLSEQFQSLDSLSGFKFPSVPGRVELAGNFRDAAVFVDYAHSSQSLEFVLEAAREECLGELVVVFGCGGDRDPGKRARMGRAASRFCDRVFITNDNPRSEDPEAIAQEVQSGIVPRDGLEVQVVLDRRKAIKEAILKLKPRDCLLICGKGHEQTQIIGNTTSPFDDREVVCELIRELSS